MEMIWAHVDLRTVLFDMSWMHYMSSTMSLFGPLNLIIVTNLQMKSAFVNNWFCIGHFTESSSNNPWGRYIPLLQIRNVRFCRHVFITVLHSLEAVVAGRRHVSNGIPHPRWKGLARQVLQYSEQLYWLAFLLLADCFAQGLELFEASVAGVEKGVHHAPGTVNQVMASPGGSLYTWQSAACHTSCRLRSLGLGCGV